MGIEFTQTGSAWFFVSRGSTFHLGKITKSHEYGPLFNGMTIEEIGAILAKMKELQSEVKK